MESEIRVAVQETEEPQQVLFHHSVGMSNNVTKFVPEVTQQNGHAEPVSISPRIQATAMQIVYKNLSWTVKVQDKNTKSMVDKKILKGVEGVFHPGRLCAILGASGAGKTTLLNLVAGVTQTGVIGGEVRVNNEPVASELMRRISAFVQQDDVIMDTMTVREALSMSALLRLPKGMPEADKLARVDEIIELLQLTKCQDSRIGNSLQKGISGGERRRVSLGIEMITNPSMLFLDEPTSGLDTYTAYSVIKILKTVASHGRTVVATIHQPSSDIFHMFDDLVLLAEGQVMYHGPAANVVPYFNQRGYPCPNYTNPADHLFMRVLNANKEAAGELKSPKSQQHHETEQERIASLLAQWKSSSEQRDLANQIAHPLTGEAGALAAFAKVQEKAGFATQFGLLARRAFRNLLRHRLLVRGRLAQSVILSFLAALIYLNISNDQKGIQDREGSLFFITVQSILQTTMSVLTNFGGEKAVFKREFTSGMYSLPSYFMSRTIVELPFRFLFPTISSSILYWLIGYQYDGTKYANFWITVILMELCGSALGIFVACMFSDIAIAIAMLPMFLMPLMIFSGFFVNTSNIPPWFRWLSYLSPMKYGFQSLAQNEFGGLELYCTPEQMVQAGNHTICPITNGQQVLDLLSFESNLHIQEDLLILLAMFVGLLFLAFLALKRSASK